MNVVHKYSLIVTLAAFITGPVFGRGVSPYLPLGTSPEIERDVESVLILAGKPILRRPIPTATVLDALPAACAVDPGLCQRVRNYLKRYQKNYGVTEASIEASADEGGTDQTLPNAHGRDLDSNWQVVGAAFYQPSDFLSLNAGGIAYDGRAMPTGTLLSAGFNWAQLDVGFRDHWLSPLSTSSMLISTEAPTMPSVTLSNYKPLSPLGVTYEIFVARMSHQDGIEYFSSRTNGSPTLAGVHGGIEPVTGYALSVNKLMQYGGGARDGAGLSDLRRAIFSNSYSENSPDGYMGKLEFGNQLASLAATMQFPGRVPFALSIEYAGEDYLYAYDGNYRLGDSAFSLGLNIPKFWQRYDLKLESTEWQNAWYVHHLYPRGLTNDGFVLGHWFGDQRRFGDRVAGNSQVLQVGMRADNGNYWLATYRRLAFTSSYGFQLPSEIPYRHMHEMGLRYSTGWLGHQLAADLSFGRTVFGEKYGRLSTSIDLLKSASESRPYLAEDHSTIYGKTDFFVDAGFNRSSIHQQITQIYPDYQTQNRNNYHLGVGVRRPITKRSDLGMRLELDKIDDGDLVSIRALDYRFKIASKYAMGAFGGVGRYNYGAPAFGWYGGLGLQMLEVLPKWSLNLDWRYHDKLSRDRILKSDPPGTIKRPRLHFDVKSFTFYVSRNF